MRALREPVFVQVAVGAALLGKALTQESAQRLAAWNGLGTSGLAACSLFLAVLMIPRVLDLTLLDARIEFAKRPGDARPASAVLHRRPG